MVPRYLIRLLSFVAKWLYVTKEKVCCSRKWFSWVIYITITKFGDDHKTWPGINSRGGGASNWIETPWVNIFTQYQHHFSFHRQLSPCQPNQVPLFCLSFTGSTLFPVPYNLNHTQFLSLLHPRQIIDNVFLFNVWNFSSCYTFNEF